MSRGVTSSRPVAPLPAYWLSDSLAGRVGVDTDNRSVSAISPVIARLEGLYGHSRRGAWRLGTAGTAVDTARRIDVRSPLGRR